MFTDKPFDYKIYLRSLSSLILFVSIVSILSGCSNPTPSPTPVPEKLDITSDEILYIYDNYSTNEATDWCKEHVRGKKIEGLGITVTYVTVPDLETGMYSFKGWSIVENYGINAFIRVKDPDATIVTSDIAEGDYVVVSGIIAWEAVSGSYNPLTKRQGVTLVLERGTVEISE